MQIISVCTFVASISGVVVNFSFALATSCARSISPADDVRWTIARNFALISTVSALGALFSELVLIKNNPSGAGVGIWITIVIFAFFAILTIILFAIFIKARKRRRDPEQREMTHVEASNPVGQPRPICGAGENENGRGLGQKAPPIQAQTSIDYAGELPNTSTYDKQTQAQLRLDTYRERADSGLHPIGPRAPTGQSRSQAGPPKFP